MEGSMIIFQEHERGDLGGKAARVSCAG